MTEKYEELKNNAEEAKEQEEKNKIVIQKVRNRLKKTYRRHSNKERLGQKRSAF